MLTPKQLRQLGEILLQETQVQAPDLSAYIGNALLGKPTRIGESFRLSANGHLDASRPAGPKAYLVRMKTRAIVRAITRIAQAGIPVGSATKEWMQSALRAADFRQEAENCLRTQQAAKAPTD